MCKNYRNRLIDQEHNKYKGSLKKSKLTRLLQDINMRFSGLYSKTVIILAMIVRIK